MNGNMTLLFCGDFASCRRWYDVEPNAKVFGDMLPYIKEANLAFVNLETPATNVGKPILKDGPNLRTKPEWLTALKEVGFGLIGLANNHMGDYGPESVIDCLNNCKEQGLQTVGAGKNLLDSQRIFYFEKNSVKLAIIAVCEHEFGIAEDSIAGTAPLDTIDNIRQLREAKRNSDFVIITIHGGNEYFPYPRPGLRKQCQFYIEQGCDAIVCHHPHIPGAYEEYNGKPIFYSIGNFLFDAEIPPKGWNEGYAVKLILSKNENIKFELMPYTQSFEQGCIKLLADETKSAFLKRLNNYKSILSNTSEYSKVWTEFCKSKTDTHLFLQYCPVRFRGVGRLIKLLGGASCLVKKTKRLARRLNFVRCESHQEVFLNILSKELEKMNDID